MVSKVTNITTWRLSGICLDVVTTYSNVPVPAPVTPMANSLSHHLFHHCLSTHVSSPMLKSTLACCTHQYTRMCSNFKALDQTFLGISMRKFYLESVFQWAISFVSRKIAVFGGMAPMRSESRAISQHRQVLSMADSVDSGPQKLNHQRKRLHMRRNIMMVVVPAFW